MKFLGHDVEQEKRRLSSINIIISTPGRLLQHMDENETFSCDNLQMLIIDEADRILDMGFKSQVNFFFKYFICLDDFNYRKFTR